MINLFNVIRNLKRPKFEEQMTGLLSTLQYHKVPQGVLPIYEKDYEQMVYYIDPMRQFKKLKYGVRFCLPYVCYTSIEQIEKKYVELLKQLVRGKNHLTYYPIHYKDMIYTTIVVNPEDRQFTPPIHFNVVESVFIPKGTAYLFGEPEFTGIFSTAGSLDMVGIMVNPAHIQVVDIQRAFNKKQFPYLVS